MSGLSEEQHGLLPHHVMRSVDVPPSQATNARPLSKCPLGEASARTRRRSPLLPLSCPVLISGKKNATWLHFFLPPTAGSAGLALGNRQRRTSCSVGGRFELR